MRYGGHQTFTLRDGWLYKGMDLLMNEEKRDLLVDKQAMDYLGVGRNMAKSINHWLLATGLATKKKEENTRGNVVEKKDLKPTPLAEIIWKYDKYFMDKGTWWIIHLNMLKNQNHGATWYWFFNRFGQERFPKQICFNNLKRYESLNSSRTPSDSTLDRDLSCFLASYSMEVPARDVDPEDEIYSPLIDLGLMTYYRSSGYYNVKREKRAIPYSIFLYCLALSEPEGLFQNKEKSGQVVFFDLLQWENGPSRTFLLGNEDLFELLLDYDNHHKDFSLMGMAGERIIKYPRSSSFGLDFLETYYQTLSLKEAQ